MKPFNPILYKLIARVLYLVFVTGFTSAIPGNYETFSILENKRLPNPITKYTGLTDVAECKAHCIKDPKCESYSYSKFERACLTYVLNLGTEPIINNGFTLYVRAKTREDGYARYGAKYIRLILEMKSFYAAQKYCESLHGMLVAVRTQELNDLLMSLMIERNVFTAYIGLTDEEQEGTWKYMDSGTLMYENWSFDGMWARRDRNCALISIDGTWKHHDCVNPAYFFCEIPMF